MNKKQSNSHEILENCLDFEESHCPIKIFKPFHQTSFKINTFIFVGVDNWYMVNKWIQCNFITLFYC